MKAQIFAALLWLAPLTTAVGCEPRKPVPLETAIGQSEHVFIFRLVAAGVADSGTGAPAPTTAVGNIRLIQTFKGRPKFSRLGYVIGDCRGNLMQVGGYYVAATSQQGTNLLLGGDYDFAILDITSTYGWFNRSPRTQEYTDKIALAASGKYFPSPGYFGGFGHYPGRSLPTAPPKPTLGGEKP